MPVIASFFAGLERGPDIHLENFAVGHAENSITTRSRPGGSQVAGTARCSSVGQVGEQDHVVAPSSSAPG
jgi:hypothetical protein